MTKKPTENPINDLHTFIEKVDEMKKQNKMDLSSDQDLTLAIMNLVSIEEHFIFTGAKTHKNKYYDFVEQVREIRKQLMQKIIKKYEGEVWCISKHLLASSMRLMEVGTKQLSLKKKKEAYDMFQKAYDLYSLFWGLNMNLIDTKDVKKINTKITEKASNTESISSKEKKGLMGALRGVVHKLIDCCIE